MTTLDTLRAIRLLYDWLRDHGDNCACPLCARTRATITKLERETT